MRWFDSPHFILSLRWVSEWSLVIKISICTHMLYWSKCIYYTQWWLIFPGPPSDTTLGAIDLRQSLIDQALPRNWMLVLGVGEAFSFAALATATGSCFMKDLFDREWCNIWFSEVNKSDHLESTNQRAVFVCAHNVHSALYASVDFCQ